MVSFKRMKDDFEETYSRKIQSRLSKSCILLTIIALLLIIIFGLIIGFASHQSIGKVLIVSLNNQSCPPLSGERLLTTMSIGESFEGLILTLSCNGDYVPFPITIRCRRKSSFDNNLVWSHLPVCYPSTLISNPYSVKNLHIRSVSCNGDSSSTTCSLSCVGNYIAVEKNPYVCTESPCRAWSLNEGRCYVCDVKCKELASKTDVGILKEMNCGNCNSILVTSRGNASVWQNKRTGLFSFIGEHNSRPVYQNNATQEFLFYSLSGSEWLVGPHFKKSYAGIQVIGNENQMCPEQLGGPNVQKLYIDSSDPSKTGLGTWKNDSSINFECIESNEKINQLYFECGCNEYKIYNLVYPGNTSVPISVDYLSGFFVKRNQRDFGLLAPIYFNKIKNLYLFSHHHEGRVWSVSSDLSSSPLRGIMYKNAEGSSFCPDNNQLYWEWFNVTRPGGVQEYIRDKYIQIKCIN